MRLSAFIATRALAALGSAVLGSAALADPCKAIPDHGPAPAYLAPGAAFSGQVVYVGDGDSLCVALGPRTDQWVEVRLADFYAPELHDPGGAQAKATLSHLAYGRRASCIADHQSHDRMVATCRINGRSLGDMMRAAGVHEGGRAYPSRVGRTPGPAPLLVVSGAPSEPSPAWAGFANCAAARAAGAAPLYRGDPGYSARLDRDGDGVACEPYRRR